MRYDRVRYLAPIVETLREMGGSGRTAEVIDRVIEQLGISEEEQSEQVSTGGSRVRNQIQWARWRLVLGGIIDKSEKGVWTLTPLGHEIDVSTFDFESMHREVGQKYRSERRQRRKQRAVNSEDLPDEVTQEALEDHREQLMRVLLDLPPAGFERLCQRLLRESGFQQVKVTARPGDGGIDGVGLLQLNAFVSFTVLFQCKRYAGSISPSQIRDFRGAMLGRADKGLFLTTGTFTTEAKKEARRDGVPPIELVDGDSLVDLFETLELGLKPRRAYTVVDEFFDEFRRL